jgi:hypothetical protein
MRPDALLDKVQLTSPFAFVFTYAPPRRYHFAISLRENSHARGQAG